MTSGVSGGYAYVSYKVCEPATSAVALLGPSWPLTESALLLVGVIIRDLSSNVGAFSKLLGCGSTSRRGSRERLLIVARMRISLKQNVVPWFLIEA